MRAANLLPALALALVPVQAYLYEGPPAKGTLQLAIPDFISASNRQGDDQWGACGDNLAIAHTYTIEKAGDVKSFTMTVYDEGTKDWDAKGDCGSGQPVVAKVDCTVTLQDTSTGSTLALLKEEPWFQRLDFTGEVDAAAWSCHKRSSTN